MKKIFLSLLLGFVGLISFSSAGVVEFTGSVSVDKPDGGSFLFYIPSVSNSNNIFANNSNFSVNCTFNNITNDFKTQVATARVVLNGYGKSNIGTYNITSSNNTLSFSWNYQALLFVSFSVVDDRSVITSFDYVCTISGDRVGYNCPVCETCPEVNTGDILSGSCDTNYCVENDLCPVPSNFSQLFINDLEFPGKPLINVNIPDYIQWDYSSTDTGFDLYVGSGYDQDYIDSVLKINSYRPDSSDFTNIFVSGLTLLFPYLIFALFLVFMRKLIKRIFKH